MAHAASFKERRIGLRSVGSFDSFHSYPVRLRTAWLLDFSFFFIGRRQHGSFENDRLAYVQFSGGLSFATSSKIQTPCLVIGADR